MTLPYPIHLEFDPPDISPFRSGNCGIPFVFDFQAEVPGPHALITALIHGNEFCGAFALIRLLESGFRPERGRLTLANYEAALYFDPEDPHGSRFLEEDLNRVWSADRLDAPADPRMETFEMRRARELRPIVESADYLLDLHSTSGDGGAMALAGTMPHNLEFARNLGAPETIVIDAGHRGGTRLRDHARFSGEGGGASSVPAASVLVECGQHWRRHSIHVADDVTRRFLHVTGMTSEPPRASAMPQRVLIVTDIVTAESDDFRFAEPFQGLDRIERAGTVIAHDEGTPIMTPYDDCTLIMPTLATQRGLTAVRLAKDVT